MKSDCNDYGSAQAAVRVSPAWRDAAARRRAGAFLPLAACLSCGVAGLHGCERQPFHEPQSLGGQVVGPEVLNRGAVVYRKNCVACHGETGRAADEVARKMNPRPRDLSLGIFKFGSVPDDGLPTDEDMLRVLQQGLAGTDMPAFATLSPADRSAVAQYVKTLSPRWRSARVGAPVALPPDPWESRDDREAQQRGEVVYHREAECWSCHPSYATRESILAMPAGAGGTDASGIAWRSDMQAPRTVMTRFGEATPPDFLKTPLRSGNATRDVARTVAAGVGGTPMPSFRSRLTDADLWAVARYVRALSRKRGTPSAASSSAWDEGRPRGAASSRGSYVHDATSAGVR